jgi:hypothetical protein
MKLSANERVDAKSIITENGFIDLTPDTSLFTHKVFEKDGVKYRFDGWCELKDRKYTAVELVPIAE